MKKLFISLSGLIFFLFLIGCETENLSTNSVKSSASIMLFENDTEKIDLSEEDISILEEYQIDKSTNINQRNILVDEILLKYFAMAIAKSLKHPGICQILKEKIGEKFDGDFEVLWSNVKDNQVSDQSIRQLVDSRFSNRSRNLVSISRIEEIPLLQVALPINYDDWEGESAILVAYTPLTTDDSEWKNIYAYDSDMNEYILDANTLPDYPVIVVSLNEREEYFNQENDEIGLSKLASTINVYICTFRLMDDKEPWSKGDPEIYTKVKKYYQSNSYFVRTNFPKVNDEITYSEDDYDWLPKRIYSFISPVVELRVEVWEDDTIDDDFVEHEWCYPNPSSSASNYGPSGYKEWWYGDHGNADEIFQATGS